MFWYVHFIQDYLPESSKTQFKSIKSDERHSIRKPIKSAVPSSLFNDDDDDLFSVMPANPTTKTIKERDKGCVSDLFSNWEGNMINEF